MTERRVVLDEDDVRRTLVRIAHEIVEKNAGRPIALVGIHRRGAGEQPGEDEPGAYGGHGAEE